MKTCPKCKHQDNSKEPVSCPRCGVIYAKIEAVQRTRAAEQRLNKQFENTLKAEEEVYSQQSFSDREWELDQETYPVVQNLTAFFNIFAIITAISYLIGGIILWRMLGEAAPYITSSGRYTFTILYVMSVPFPIAIYLAIASALKLGKDIADNTRATRHYMSFLAHKKKTRT